MAKKGLLVLVLAMLIAGGAFAQDDMWTSFADGIGDSSLFVNVGIGWGLTSYDYSLPPISASVEYALPIGLPLTVGGYFGLALFDTTYYTGVQMGFGVRASWHVNFGIRNLDAYAGLTLGWMIWTLDYKSSGNRAYDLGGFYYAGNVGIRYFFIDNVGVYLEIGYSPVSIASAGLALKF